MCAEVSLREITQGIVARTLLHYQIHVCVGYGDGFETDFEFATVLAPRSHPVSVFQDGGTPWSVRCHRALNTPKSLNHVIIQSCSGVHIIVHVAS